MRPPGAGGGGDEVVGLGAGDRELLDALAADGRPGFAELAAASGLSESTVRRRLAVKRNGALLPA
ncbi:MAG TPA: AsnC family protein [Pseudonocardiaceae bacterium]|nr:AsnC family protein [Pseudonocardiaceae bacterium]